MSSCLSFRVASLACVLLCTSALPALASARAADGDTVASKGDGDDAQPVIVIGKRSSYLKTRTASGTKTDTRLQDVPQAISIVTAEQMADQGMAGLQDVVRTVPGASLDAGEGHRDQIILRGQNSTADFFVDGLRDDVQYLRTLYNLERVEVLKGPNAMIFGRGGGGGIVNRVTKKAGGARQAGAHAAIDGRGNLASAIDLGGPLSGGIAARLNAAYDRIESFRDLVDGHRLAVNPTLGATLGGGRLDLGYEYVRDRRTTDRGLPSQDGTFYKGDVRDFFGDPQVNRTRLDAHVADLSFSRPLGEALEWRAKGRFGHYDKAYANATPATAVQTNGTVGIEAYRSSTSRDSWLVQNDFLASLTTGALNHRLVAGVDLGWQSGRSTREQGFFDTMGGARRIFVPLASASSLPAISFRNDPSRPATDNGVEATTLGAYVQDQVEVGRHLELIAGLRWDRFRLDYRDNLSATRLERTDKVVSPRLGLVAKPTRALSLYASWAVSFLPQSGDQFASLTATTAALEPERFENVEIGAKWTLRDRLMATIAAYRLDRTNTRAVDPATLETVLTGAQRSKGIEVGLTGRATDRLSIALGAALQRARITETTSAALAGTTVPGVPAFQASAWARYDLSGRVGVGLGAMHSGKRFASTSNSVTLPAYERVDAALFLGLSKAIELQLNVENVLGARYAVAAHGDNNLQPGSPRNLRASLNFKL